MNRLHDRITTRTLPLVSVGVLTAVLAGGPVAALAQDDGTAATDAPTVSDFVFSPSVLRPGRKGAFRFLTSREGAGSITLSRITSTGSLQYKGRLRFAVDAGEGRRSFDGKIAGKRLPSGRYRATVVVTNAATGASAPRKLTFRIAST